MTAKTKKQLVVTLRITHGPVSPAQREKARRWWAARIAEAKSEGKSEGQK